MMNLLAHVGRGGDGTTLGDVSAWGAAIVAALVAAVAAVYAAISARRAEHRAWLREERHRSAKEFLTVTYAFDDRIVEVMALAAGGGWNAATYDSARMAAVALGRPHAEVELVSTERVKTAADRIIETTRPLLTSLSQTAFVTTMHAVATNGSWPEQDAFNEALTAFVAAVRELLRAAK